MCKATCFQQTVHMQGEYYLLRSESTFNNDVRYFSNIFNLLDSKENAPLLSDVMSMFIHKLPATKK